MDGIIQGVSVLGAGIVGVVVGIVATLAFRISELRQRAGPEAPAAELDEGLVRVLSVLRSAAVVVDDDDEVIRASPPAYALNVVRNDAIAHAAIHEMVEHVRRDGMIREQELELPRGPVGSGTVLLQVRVAPLGKRMLVLAEDRTEAARVEAIRRDFVVNVSHELKTPVGALALLAETVGDAADDPVAVRRFTERMHREATRLSDLVQEIIELSRLQSQGAVQKATPVVARTVVDEAVDRARTAAQAKNITITAGGSLDRIVYGDHNLLVTAVRNLLDNAVAYSPPATRVGVGVTERRGLIEIAVVDQGVGIDESKQDRVFERFYRVDPARSRDTGGTGLGLSIVKHVAADHGGDVTMWSEPGRGSTFTLRIPSAGPGAMPPAAAANVESEPGAPHSPSGMATGTGTRTGAAAATGTGAAAPGAGDEHGTEQGPRTTGPRNTTAGNARAGTDPAATNEEVGA